MKKISKKRPWKRTFRNIRMFLNNPLRIVEIITGIIVASFFMLTVESIANIFFYNHFGDITWYYILFPLASFVLILYPWVKLKSNIVKPVVILLVIITYVLGRNYAIENYKTYEEAKFIFNQEVKKKTEFMNNEKDEAIFLEKYQAYIDSLAKAVEGIRPSLKWGKQYYESYYQIEKEKFLYIKQDILGETKNSQEEVNRAMREFDARLVELQSGGAFLPYWVRHFRVK